MGVVSQLLQNTAESLTELLQASWIHRFSSLVQEGIVVQGSLLS